MAEVVKVSRFLLSRIMDGSFVKSAKVEEREITQSTVLDRIRLGDFGCPDKFRFAEFISKDTTLAKDPSKISEIFEKLKDAIKD